MARLDRALRRAGVYGVPLALLLAVATGLVLPDVTGWSAPFDALRALHVLAGIGLAFAAAYGLAQGLAHSARAGWRRLRLMAPAGGSDALHRAPTPAGPGIDRGVPTPGPGVAQGRAGSTGSAVSMAAVWLPVLFWVALVAMLWTGWAQYCAQRYGFSVVPGVPAAAVGALHALLAPYSYGVFLLVWFNKARRAALRVMQELRSS